MDARGAGAGLAVPADTKNIKRDRGGAPIPQVFDPAKDEYTPAIGTDGRQHAILHDEAGAPIDLAGLLGDVITAVTGTVTTLRTPWPDRY